MLEKLPRAIGHALSGLRPGFDKIASLQEDFASVPDAVVLTSAAFPDGAAIPVRYTDDGDGVSPPLEWTGVPPGTVSLALLIEDCDSPTPSPLVHAICWNLPGRDGGLAEDALPSDASPDEEAAMGKNSFLGAEYLPPDPPPGHGPHRYAFQLFALDAVPDFDGSPGRGAFLTAIKGRVLARGLLVGTYERV